MRVALAADHAGVALKREVASLLDALGVVHRDFGTGSADSVDYPDYAMTVASRVAAGEFDRGVLICGTGIGMAIAANKVRGIRAATIGDVETARLCREHNDANVLTLGARTTDAGAAMAIVRAFLDTPFAGGRHVRRLQKIAAIEDASPASTRAGTAS